MQYCVLQDEVQENNYFLKFIIMYQSDFIYSRFS